MATRYFSATDGKITVFRGSATRVYHAASFFTNSEGTRAGNISFSNAGRGSYAATEISKAEYDALQAAKIERVKARGRNPKWAISPQDSWVRNVDLTPAQEG